MPEYRLYCLDEAGRISKAEEISAPSDDDAVAIARAMNKPMACELWSRNRVVARIPAKPQHERPKKPK